MKVDNDQIKKQLAMRGIDPSKVDAIHLQMKKGEISPDSFVVESSRLKPPQEKDYDKYQDLDQEKLQIIGEQSIKNDELVVFWLNGGAATRYFDESKITPEEKGKYHSELAKLAPAIKESPKGITPVINDMTFLEIKILNLLKLTKDLGLKKHPQVILMNSFITDEATREHLDQLYKKYPDLHPSRFHFVLQKPIIPRFSKVQNLEDIDVFVDSKGELSFAPCGHGDFLFLVQDYLRKENIPDIKYMFFSNIDNFGTWIDPVILGYHINSGQGRTVELAAKNPGDKGGAPCFVDGEMMIVEDMKFPPDFDQDQIKVFNTNNFWFTVFDLENYDQELPFVIAEKVLPEGEVYQLEHFACDVNLPSAYLEVPRQTRFWPTKRYVDLLAFFEDPNFQKLLQNNYSLNLG
ncbi:UTP--glucose-1-phosphate uridylyltransferase [Patescibacteria group bacterium]|nr:UTP--glucose-1-phosphate uridylyltransferase [Patescibacteria group bacterium]MBU1672938.1 UTP--glucose-1-phosphate uridylyltransferase [Patescibacteria group bacterium]MBU1963580.1 UTP--glucose-1-phosphate uridylyltransferase [Patescibacteria group bacterium]MBU1963587.1 UTP--glucose-1-phosphate uridylyltransferase [Patescibacteria group bacterium]